MSTKWKGDPVVIKEARNTRDRAYSARRLANDQVYEARAALVKASNTWARLEKHAVAADKALVKARRGDDG